MKKDFQQPQMEVLFFPVENIMTDSAVPTEPGIELPDHEWD